MGGKHLGPNTFLQFWQPLYMMEKLLKASSLSVSQFFRYMNYSYNHQPKMDE